MRFKEIRTSRKLKQQQMADLLEIPLRTYQNYEREVNEPDIDLLCKMANAFGITVDYIVGYSDVMFSPDALDMSRDEYNLLNAYRQLNEANQTIVTRVVYALLDTAEHGGM